MTATAPLILLHGFPMTARIWAGLGEWPAEPATPDLWDLAHPPGQPAVPFTVDDLADAVHAHVGRLGRPAVVGGLSMGGYVALSLADRHPSDLAGLILFNTKATGDDAAARAGRDTMIAGIGAGSVDVGAVMGPKLLSPSASAEVRDVFRQMASRIPRHALIHALAALRDRPDRSAALPGITVPTLCVVGADDAATPPAVVDDMRRQIPTAGPLAVIPDAGHLPPLENPAATAAVLRSFLLDL